MNTQKILNNKKTEFIKQYRKKKRKYRIYTIINKPFKITVQQEIEGQL